MTVRNTFAGSHQISAEKPVRKGGQTCPNLTPGGASAGVRPPRDHIPRHMARGRRRACARVGQCRVAAPPVRPDRHTDAVLADVRVVR